VDNVKVTVNGLEKVQAALAENVKRSRRRLAPVLMSEAQVILAEAHRRVHKKTGNVARNLYIKKEKTTPNYMRVKVTLRREGAEGFPLEVGHAMSGWYAGFPGTVPAYPFMRPAFESKHQQVEKGLVDGMIQAATRK
jgi:hypothetical protein